MTKIDPMDLFKKVLIDEAIQRGWQVRETAKELLANTYRSTKVARQFSSEPYDEREGYVQNDVEAVSLDFCNVLIGFLGDDAHGWEDCLKRHHAQAAIARSWLDGKAEVDLYLMLVGPLGSAGQSLWQDAASSIERDERICRKMVWLPADDQALATRDLKKFFERTFLAQPWLTETSQDQQDLDSLGAIERELGERFFKETQLPSSLLGTWLRVLDQTGEDGQQTAHELLAAFKELT